MKTVFSATCLSDDCRMGVLGRRSVYCYCESAGLSNVVSKALAEVCELPSNKNSTSCTLSMAISSPSQILNIANTPYKQQVDPSSIKA